MNKVVTGFPILVKLLDAQKLKGQEGILVGARKLKGCILLHYLGAGKLNA